jgi:hypothetical protein
MTRGSLKGLPVSALWFVLVHLEIVRLGIEVLSRIEDTALQHSVKNIIPINTCDKTWYTKPTQSAPKVNNG